MAIQVNGTQVIGNSRELTNIASVDATTAASITAAGVGGGGTVSLTAKGSIAAGDPVTLNTDGTVSKCGQLQSPTESFGVSAQRKTVMYDTGNDATVVVYQGNNNDSYAIVATYANGEYSFGSPVRLNSQSTYDCTGCYDPDSGKIFTVWFNASSSNTGMAMGTVSGNSISFGSTYTFSQYTDALSACYDENVNRVVLAYRDMTPNRGGVRAASISGSTITIGSQTTFQSSAVRDPRVAYDSTNLKTALVYRHSASSDQGKGSVLTISGTSVTVNSSSNFGSSTNNEQNAIAFDANTNKFVVAYKAGSAGNIGRLVTGTISGTSISFSSEVQFTSATAPAANWPGVAYSTALSQCYVSIAQGYIYPVTTSGSTPSVGTEFRLDNRNEDSDLGYNPDQSQFLYVTDDGLSGYNPAARPASFVGVATAAMSNGQTNDITVVGGVNEAVSGLTVGAPIYLENSGVLGTTSTNSNGKVGQALAANKLLITGTSTTDP